MWILTFSGCQSTEHAALLSARGFSLYTLIWSMFRMYECWCLVTNEDIMYLLVRAYVSASSSKLFWRSMCFWYIATPFRHDSTSDWPFPIRLCVCVMCTRVLFFVVMFLCAALCGRVASLVIWQMRGLWAFLSNEIKTGKQPILSLLSGGQNATENPEEIFLWGGRNKPVVRILRYWYCIALEEMLSKGISVTVAIQITLFS